MCDLDTTPDSCLSLRGSYLHIVESTFATFSKTSNEVRPYHLQNTFTECSHSLQVINSLGCGRLLLFQEVEAGLGKLVSAYLNNPATVSF